MSNASGRDVFEITLTMPWLPAATESGGLDPAISATAEPVPPPEGLDSAQKQVVQDEHECEEAVDWETIAGYLSRCQSTHSTLSQSTTSNFEPINRQSQSIGSNNPYRDLLLRRSASSIPPSMSKNPTNTTPQPTATPTSIPSGGLSTGAKAGIAGGAAVGIVIILAGLVAFHTHRRRKRYGYNRTKGRDGIPSEFEGRFVVTGDRGEGSPMMYDNRRESESTGLGIEIIPGGPLSPELVGGHTPLMNSYNNNNTSTASHYYYPTSPTMEDHLHYNAPSIRPSPSQTFDSRPSPPEPEEDPFVQHNQRARPSHPLASLSEAIPPPPLAKRYPHSMADYQNAVPLGFANGFVQIERVESEEGDRNEIERFEAEDEQHDLGLGDRPADRVEEQDGPDGDESLPVYEEMDISRERPREKVEFRGKRDDDDDSESDEERRFEVHLTKSDLG